MLDASTEKFLSKIRCGVPDYQSSSDLLEHRRRLRMRARRHLRRTLRREKRYNLSTFRWNKKEITFRLLNGPRRSSMTKSAAHNVIRAGIRAWEKVVDLTFREVRTGRADIEMSFQDIGHAVDEDNGDFEMDTVAHAFFPPPYHPVFSGHVHFNNAFNYTNRARKSSTIPEVNLMDITMHEVGHALGLFHSTEPSSIMTAGVDDSDTPPKLSTDDIAAIQNIYGKKPLRTPSNGRTSASTVTQNGVSEEDGDIATCFSCGRSYYVSAGSSRLMKSPNYPDPYPNNAHCVYFVIAGARERIQLYAKTFSTAGIGDFLTIYDGLPHADTFVNSISGTFAAGYLMGESGATFRSSGNKITLIFTSDHNVTLGGFQIIAETTLYGCGGRYVLSVHESTFLESPNYPQDYPNNAHCVYVLVAPANCTIRFRSIAFDTEDRHDFVRLNNGVDYSTRSLTAPSWSGSSSLPWLSSSKVATLVFTSDHSVQESGFKIAVDVVNGSVSIGGNGQSSNACGGTFSLTANQTLLLQSPRYPLAYPESANCIYRLSAPEGWRIRVRPIEFSTEYNYDFLRIYNGAVITFTISSVSWHGDYVTAPWQSTESAVTLAFTSDSSGSSSGFQLAIELIAGFACSRNYTISLPVSQPAFLLESPNYPDEYRIVACKPLRSIRGREERC